MSASRSPWRKPGLSSDRMALITSGLRCKCRAAMRQMDEDGSGEVDFDEFLAW